MSCVHDGGFGTSIACAKCNEALGAVLDSPLRYIGLDVLVTPPTPEDQLRALGPDHVSPDNAMIRLLKRAKRVLRLVK